MRHAAAQGTAVHRGGRSCVGSLLLLCRRRRLLHPSAGSTSSVLLLLLRRQRLASARGSSRHCSRSRWARSAAMAAIPLLGGWGAVLAGLDGAFVDDPTAPWRQAALQRLSARPRRWRCRRVTYHAARRRPRSPSRQLPRSCSVRSSPRTSCTARSTASWSRSIVGPRTGVAFAARVFQGTMARSVPGLPRLRALRAPARGPVGPGAGVGPLPRVLLLLPLFVARWAYAQYAEEQRAYDRTVRTLMAAVETKDVYTRGHSERVVGRVGAVARAIGMREDRVASLRYAGMLHDVGKLGVPDPGAAEVRPASPRRVRGDPAAPGAGPGDSPRDRVPGRGVRRDHAPPRAARRSRLPDGPAR